MKGNYRQSVTAELAPPAEALACESHFARKALGLPIPPARALSHSWVGAQVGNTSTSNPQ